MLSRRWLSTPMAPRLGFEPGICLSTTVTCTRRVVNRRSGARGARTLARRHGADETTRLGFRGRRGRFRVGRIAFDAAWARGRQARGQQPGPRQPVPRKVRKSAGEEHLNLSHPAFSILISLSSRALSAAFST